MNELTRKALVFLVQAEIDRQGLKHKFFDPKCKRCVAARELLAELASQVQSEEPVKPGVDVVVEPPKITKKPILDRVELEL